MAIMMRSFSRVTSFCLMAIIFYAQPCQAQWHQFTWVKQTLSDSLIPKAAIFLPAKLDGIGCTMQLDTGAGTSVLYRNALPISFGTANALDQIDTLEIKHLLIGGRVSSRTFPLMSPARVTGQPTHCDSVSGTIGNDYFLGSNLTLDLPRARFRIRQGAALPDEVKKARYVFPMNLIDTGNGGVVPVLDAQLGNGDAVKLLFDTGSAPANITIFLERHWLELVGLDSIDQAVAFSSIRWGRPIKCYSGTLVHAINVGDMSITKGSIAHYCADPAEPAHEENKLYGVLGLAPFIDSKITLDYVGRQLIVAPSRTIRGQPKHHLQHG